MSHFIAKYLSKPELIAFLRAILQRFRNIPLSPKTNLRLILKRPSPFAPIHPTIIRKYFTFFLKHTRKSKQIPSLFVVLRSFVSVSFSRNIFANVNSRYLRRLCYFRTQRSVFCPRDRMKLR